MSATRQGRKTSPPVRGGGMAINQRRKPLTPQPTPPRPLTALEQVAVDLAGTMASPSDVAIIGHDCFRIAGTLNHWSPLAPLLARLGEILRARADIDRSEADA